MRLPVACTAALLPALIATATADLAEAAAERGHRDGTSVDADAERTSFRSRTLPPGARLPSGRECASRLARTSWEPRPQNREANRTVPPPGVFDQIDGGDRIAQRRFLPRITGRFRGRTGELLRWASCKWGFDPVITKARAWTESSWRQSMVGDGGESFGLLQVKRTVHGGYPWVARSSALNLDYALAWVRSCYEGWMSHWLPASARGDEWGCVGLWYSGEWKRNEADYRAEVRNHLAARPWRELP